MSNIFPKATKYQSWWLIKNILLRVSRLFPLMNIQCNSYLCFAIHRRSRLNYAIKSRKKKEKKNKFSQKNLPSSLEPRRNNITNPLLPTSNPKKEFLSRFVCCLSEDTRCRGKYQKLRRILRGESENTVECLHETGLGRDDVREGEAALHGISTYIIVSRRA